MGTIRNSYTRYALSPSVEIGGNVIKLVPQATYISGSGGTSHYTDYAGVHYYDYYTGTAGLISIGGDACDFAQRGWSRGSKDEDYTVNCMPVTLLGINRYQIHMSDRSAYTEKTTTYGQTKWNSQTRKKYS